MGSNQCQGKDTWKPPKERGRSSVSPLVPLAPDKDRDSFSAALRLWALAIADVTDQSLRSGDLKSCIQRIYCQLDPLELLSGLDALCDAHLLVCANKAEPSLIREVLGTVPSSLRGFVTTVERGVGRISSRDPSAVRSWRQVLAFLLRPDYGFLEGGQFKQEWLSRNAAVSETLPSSVEENFQFVTSHGFDSVAEHYFFPHHGPGSVSFWSDNLRYPKTARLTINQKDALIWNDEAYDQRFTDHLPSRPDRIAPSVLLDVPKSWKKRRLIAVESAGRMFLQQGLKEALFAAIRYDDFWSRHIDFQHAEKVYPYIRSGSRTGRYATIDLSAASDSVRLGVVERLFGTTSWLGSTILRARAQEAFVDGEIVPIRMFASMGNATTFPVETLLFGTACVEAIRKYGDHPSASNFRVYGDDILIESKYAPYLLSTLEQYGFSVNHSKSFFDPASHFRESCGREYYWGVDVTPVRLPRGFAFPSFSDASLSAIASWVDICNECYFKGLFQTASEIRRCILAEARRAIPCSDTPGRGFFTPCGENGHLPSLYSPWYQRCTHIYPGLRAITEDRVDSVLAIYEWLGRAHSGDLSVLHPEWEGSALYKAGLICVGDPDSARETSRIATGAMAKTILWF